MNEPALVHLEQTSLAPERKIYEIVWAWRVAGDPFKYTRQLFKIWMRRRLPLRSLRTQGSLDGTVTVRIEVDASEPAALLEWLSFAPRGRHAIRSAVGKRVVDQGSEACRSSEVRFAAGVKSTLAPQGPAVKKRQRRKPKGTEAERLERLATAISELPLEWDQIWLGERDDDEMVALEVPARVWKEILAAGRQLDIWE